MSTQRERREAERRHRVWPSSGARCVWVALATHRDAPRVSVARIVGGSGEHRVCGVVCVQECAA